MRAKQTNTRLFITIQPQKKNMKQSSECNDGMNDSKFLFVSFRTFYDTIRHDTVEEFNVDSKAEYSA